MADSCNCDYNNQPVVTRCVTCSSPNESIVSSCEDITQKRIWNQVRIPSSIYSMNISSLTSGAERLKKSDFPPNINWNQMSDRQIASIQPAIHSSHGNSTKSTLTSSKPGSQTPGGTGVDVKHNSYARYLNRKKAGNLKTQSCNSREIKPIYGNKTYATNAVSTSIQCNCDYTNPC